MTATAGSVTAPSPRLASVTPSWQLERYRSSRRFIPSARRARIERSAWASSRDARACTAANSAATKNAFNATSASVAKIFPAISTAGVVPGAGEVGKESAECWVLSAEDGGLSAECRQEINQSQSEN